MCARIGYPFAQALHLFPSASVVCTNSHTLSTRVALPGISNHTEFIGLYSVVRFLPPCPRVKFFSTLWHIRALCFMLSSLQFLSVHRKCASPPKGRLDITNHSPSPMCTLLYRLTHKLAASNRTNRAVAVSGRGYRH